MQKHSRNLATILLLVITAGCLRVCPPPQTLVPRDLQAGQCDSGHMVTEFGVRSTGLQFELLSSDRNLHVCVVLQKSR